MVLVLTNYKSQKKKRSHISVKLLASALPSISERKLKLVERLIRLTSTLQNLLVVGWLQIAEEEINRIYLCATLDNLIVTMRTSRRACTTHITYYVATLYLLPACRFETTHMRIKGTIAISVIDNDVHAISTMIGDSALYYPVSGSVDRCARTSSEVDTAVKLYNLINRMGTIPEAGSNAV